MAKKPKQLDLSRVFLGELSYGDIAADLERLINDHYNVGISQSDSGGGLELCQEESDTPYGAKVCRCLQKIVSELNKLEGMMEEHEDRWSDADL